VGQFVGWTIFTAGCWERLDLVVTWKVFWGSQLRGRFVGDGLLLLPCLRKERAAMRRHGGAIV